jgi:formylglycine-generating enzyme required for sulfatase activity
MRARSLPALALFGAAAAATALAAQSAVSTSTYRETIPGTTVSFEMVQVPGGTVTVDGKAVTVAPFAIGRTEVTWDMYDVFALNLDARSTSGGRGADAIARPSQPYGAPDYGWGHAGYPAISITKSAAEAFAEWLSKTTGKHYRLPTDAEWTHAAILAAGGPELDPKRADEIAWHAGSADAKTHPVGTKKPDALGLFDLFGNAQEWVDTGGDRLLTRGGSFRDPAAALGPAARAEQDDSWNERDPQLPKSSWWLSDGPFVGFRLVLSGEPGGKNTP